MRLGEMLLAEGLLSREGLEEALESQVVHGGRLGTNLMELGLVKEKDLALVLGKQHKVAFASGEMKADPRAVELIEPQFGDDKDVLPMRVDATRVTLATINPRDIATLDAIAFRVGKRVVPVVIPEFRMNQLLRRHYKAWRPMRAIDMDTVRPARTLAPKGQEKEKVGDLMSEEEFQSLYAKALEGDTPAAGAEEEEIVGVEVTEPESSPLAAAPHSAPLPSAAPPARPPQALPPRAAARLTPTGTPAALSQKLPRVAEPIPEAPGVAASELPPAPLSFPEAQKLLQASNDREDVARTVLRFALGKWKRVLLLSVQRDLLTGWHGAGHGIREQSVRKIGVALRGQSTFKLVRDTRSHYVGPMRRDPGTAVFYKLLGGGFPATAVLLPLLVREKLVHILYVDNGPDQLTPPDVGELLILSQSVARSYEAMMRRRKVA
ncbi:MAG: general secretion pathway protein GspE [Myxococcales bacterium]|nr:general secretion pathway protein GspE [Myxococcales bacterium]